MRLLWLMLLVACAGAALADTPPVKSVEAALPAEDDLLNGLAEDKPARAPRVPWLVDVPWTDVLARAQESDRPILLDFTATWCGPCKLLDVMVFTEKPVISQLADVVTFQVDIDKPEYRHLKESFGVEVVPTLVWCDKDGREVDRFTGYVSSAQFLGILGAWRSERSIDRVLAEQQGASPQDPAVLLDLARRQAERGHDRQADVLYRRLANLRFEADWPTVARGMIGLAGIEHRSGRFAEARHLAGQAAAFHGKSRDPELDESSRDEVMLEVALFQESIGDTLGMLETYRGLAESDKRSVLALHGYARAAAKTGVDLPNATRAALRAVVYSDNDPDVINTLAECYYWRGLYAKAIRWQEKAVGAAPHQQLYRKQLQRYEAARSADPYGLRGPPVRN